MTGLLRKAGLEPLGGAAQPGEVIIPKVILLKAGFDVVDNIEVEALAEHGSQISVVLDEAAKGAFCIRQAALTPNLLLHGGGEPGLQSEALPLRGLTLRIPQDERSQPDARCEGGSERRFSDGMADEASRHEERSGFHRLTGEEAFEVVRERDAIGVTVRRAVGEGFEQDAFEIVDDSGNRG